MKTFSLAFGLWVASELLATGSIGLTAPLAHSPIVALHCLIAPLPHCLIDTNQAPEITLFRGQVITASARVRPGTYRLTGTDSSPALIVRGSNITLDLTGVTIEGGDPFADPDGYQGTGIAIEGGDHVTVRGGAIRGFKVGILARDSPFVHLTALDLSYNWKQRLWSGIEKESLLDWMSYHDNEKDEWLRYGAAIYLSVCDDAEIDHNTAVQGQNGLMVTRSARLKVWNNTFSFRSSIGMGMYRTTDSVVAHNRFDYDVRGYSHGFYYRGQDSTGILMYEQSSRNQVHHNSVTRGGDGLFLWAGQSTMDTGQGGANDNHFEGNDFSHAVANGIETTFSRNNFLMNRVDDCWHGVWGGYSYDSLFVGNQFVGNDEAIAIEHGQDIAIIANSFRDNKVGIRLWANATQDPNWGYPKNRDTRSRDIVIRENGFTRSETAIDVMRSENVRVMGNAFAEVATTLKVGVAVPTLTLGEREGRWIVSPQAPPLPDGMDALLPEGGRRGRSTILVDDWGPYDYKSPKVWPVGKATDRPLKLQVLGPEGAWTLVSVPGGRVDKKAGTLPDELTVTMDGRGADVHLTFEYIGGPVVDPRGRRTAAGEPHRFTYELVEPAIDWNARWWTWTEAQNPLTAPEAFAARVGEPPTFMQTVQRFDLISGRVLVDGLPPDRLALRAEGVVTLPAGRWSLTTISDDGLRVWVDDQLVVDRWDIHESTLDRVALSPGRHRIRLEYFEATGWAELKVRFIRH